MSDGERHGLEGIGTVGMGSSLYVGHLQVMGFYTSLSGRGEVKEVMDHCLGETGKVKSSVRGLSMESDAPLTGGDWLCLSGSETWLLMATTVSVKREAGKDISCKSVSREGG